MFSYEVNVQSCKKLELYGIRHLLVCHLSVVSHFGSAYRYRQQIVRLKLGSRTHKLKIVVSVAQRLDLITSTGTHKFYSCIDRWLLSYLEYPMLSVVAYLLFVH